MSITPHYFINSKRKLDVQFSICGKRQLKLTGLPNPSLVYLVATVNEKLLLISWQNSNEKICIWVSRILLKRKDCCKQVKYIILRVPQNKMGAWFGHLLSLSRDNFICLEVQNLFEMNHATRVLSFFRKRRHRRKTVFALHMNIMRTADIQMK